MSEDIDYGMQRAMAKRRLTKSTEILLGLITGIVVDDQLHDREVLFLRHWMSENPDVCAEWPGSVVARKIADILSDGVISAAERDHLLDVLRGLAVTDFSSTGSVQPEPLSLPLQDVPVVVQGRGVCHTGVFLYGTRQACEELTLRAGGLPVASVSKKVAYLVIGTNVSPDWAHTSYGRKIESAVALRSKGHGIAIVSEKAWLSALDAAR